MNTSDLQYIPCQQWALRQRTAIIETVPRTDAPTTLNEALRHSQEAETYLVYGERVVVHRHNGLHCFSVTQGGVCVAYVLRRDWQGLCTMLRRYGGDAEAVVWQCVKGEKGGNG